MLCATHSFSISHNSGQFPYIFIEWHFRFIWLQYSMYISTPLINRRPSVFYPETEVSITRLVTHLHTLTLSLVALRATGTHSLILVFYPETESRSALQT